MGMACLHPHPKNLFAFTLCPLLCLVSSTILGFGYKAFAAPCFDACTCACISTKRIDGARDPRGHGPFTMISNVYNTRYYISRSRFGLFKSLVFGTFCFIKQTCLTLSALDREDSKEATLGVHCPYCPMPKSLQILSRTATQLH